MYFISLRIFHIIKMVNSSCCYNRYSWSNWNDGWVKKENNKMKANRLKKIHVILSSIIPSIIYITQLLLRKDYKGELIIKKFGISSTFDDLLAWIPFAVGIFIVYWLIYWIVIQINRRVPPLTLTILKLITLLVILILLLKSL